MPKGYAATVGVSGMSAVVGDEFLSLFLSLLLCLHTCVCIECVCVCLFALVWFSVFTSVLNV